MIIITNIVEKWDRQVEKSLDSIAIQYGNRGFKYKEIDEKSDKLAEFLSEKGINNESLVGVLLESSDYYIVSILAILKAGGAFIPIDPAYPKERIEFILRDSKMKLLITIESYMKDIEFNGLVINISEEDSWRASSVVELGSIKNSIKTNNLAYIIYTSGTTGFPKGVMIEHKSVVNLSNWFNATYDVTKNKNIIQITNISFDVSIEEIFGALLNGGTLFIPPRSVMVHKVHFRDYINENKINILQTVPIMLKELILNNSKFESIKAIICGGEALDEELKNSILLKGYDLYNHYGPTEITVDATSYKCSLEEKVSIGIPIDNMYCYVIHDNRKVEMGEIGELYIAGVGLARGYLNNQPLTEEKFVIDTSICRKKMYRTGDLVMYNYKMQLMYIGRIDEQIKIRGNRVELKEIKTHIINHPKVKEAATLVIEDEDKQKKLVVFWEGQASADEIMAKLSKHLPSYIMPNYFIKVKKFKYTLNGKLDKEDLKAYLKIQQSKEIQESKEISKNNSKILKVLSEAFNTDINALHENQESSLQYFGIDSIAFVQAIVLLEDEFDIEFEDEYLNYEKFNNINEVIQYIDELRRRTEQKGEKV